MSTDDIEVQTCADCGIPFGFPAAIAKIWKGSHKVFFCPNGHTLSWKEATLEQKELISLRTEVKSLQEKLTAALVDIEVQKKKVEELSFELEIWRPSPEDSVKVKS